MPEELGASRQHSSETAKQMRQWDQEAIRRESDWKVKSILIDKSSGFWLD